MKAHSIAKANRELERRLRASQDLPSRAACPSATSTTVSKPRPLAECTVADLKNHHALVYGRCRVWYHNLTDTGPEAVWSRWAWWKAMHYSHRGSPRHASAWGIYAGMPGYTGPGDAQITHFVPMLDAPEGAPVGDQELARATGATP